MGVTEKVLYWINKHCRLRWPGRLQTVFPERLAKLSDCGHLDLYYVPRENSNTLKAKRRNYCFQKKMWHLLDGIIKYRYLTTLSDKSCEVNNLTSSILERLPVLSGTHYPRQAVIFLDCQLFYTTTYYNYSRYKHAVGRFCSLKISLMRRKLMKYNVV